jgi:hypothetical protein
MHPRNKISPLVVCRAFAPCAESRGSQFLFVDANNLHGIPFRALQETSPSLYIESDVIAQAPGLFANLPFQFSPLPALSEDPAAREIGTVAASAEDLYAGISMAMLLKDLPHSLLLVPKSIHADLQLLSRYKRLQKRARPLNVSAPASCLPRGGNSAKRLFRHCATARSFTSRCSATSFRLSRRRSTAPPHDFLCMSLCRGYPQRAPAFR